MARTIRRPKTGARTISAGYHLYKAALSNAGERVASVPPVRGWGPWAPDTHDQACVHTRVFPNEMPGSSIVLQPKTSDETGQ
jgi:hypothetical protein